VVPPVAKSEAARFSTDRSGVVGLAYDLVSHRILFGDRIGRKLVVVSEGSSHPLDLVRADSAGFKDISAIEIDDKRGDLWVTSAADENGAGTLHRLQLVSGRPLRSFRVPAAKTPVNLADVAITRGGTVLILDAASGTILQLRPGAAAIERVMHVDVTGPVSLAVGSEEGIAYLAHRDGVSRLDLRAGSASTMSAPKNASLAGLEQIRWYRTALIGISSEAGSTRIVRFDLNASERSVRRATTIEASAPLVAHAAVTISGDDLLYLSPVVAGATEFVAYRVHLK
jgi:streptogramin lyase